MMISQPAFMCLEASWRRLFRHPESEAAAIVPPDMPAIAGTTDVAEPGVALSAENTVLGATDGGQETANDSVPTGPLTAAERRARAAALRGLALSRGRSFDAARAAFTEAARLDPTLDLTRIPAFWKLERSAHEAAIDAYVSVGRDRDAAVLRARVRSTFRPKALRPRPGPVLTS